MIAGLFTVCTTMSFLDCTLNPNLESLSISAEKRKLRRLVRYRIVAIHLNQSVKCVSSHVVDYSTDPDEMWCEVTLQVKARLVNKIGY